MKPAAALTFQIRTGADLLQALQEKKQKPLLQTHIPALDEIQGGGLRRGSFVEVHGPSSSGRLAIALAALGAATRSGESASFIDPGHQLDIAGAEKAGIDLKRLLWIRPPSLQTALLCAEMVLTTDFALVVMDLIHTAGTLARIPAAAWLRLARAASEHKAILLTVTENPLGSVAADLVVETEPSKARWSAGQGPALLEGFSVRVGVQSRKGEWNRRTGNLIFETTKGGNT